MNSLTTMGFHPAALLSSENLQDNFLQNVEMPTESTVIIAFFPLEITEETGLIAPFAMKNHYKEIIKRMKQALKEAGPPFSELSKRQVRFFSNSRFPEKEMAVMGKLGFRGRNTLLINTEFGSRGLLGGMIIPYFLENVVQENILKSEISCGNCRLCEEACPGGALKDYKLDREKCLQHWTTEDGAVPDKLKEVWGERIYGCMICQDCCPWNRKEKKGNSIDLGIINPEPPLRFYLIEDQKEIKAEFKGTALGMTWVKAEHLTRNAILSAAASSNGKNLIEDIRKLKDSENEGIRDAVRWILKKSD